MTNLIDIEIDVTETDITDGKCADSRKCAIALALTRALRRLNPDVDPYWVWSGVTGATLKGYVQMPGRMKVYDAITPRRMAAFIVAFDDHEMLGRPRPSPIKETVTFTEKIYGAN